MHHDDNITITIVKLFVLGFVQTKKRPTLVNATFNSTSTSVGRRFCYLNTHCLRLVLKFVCMITRK